MAEWRLFPDGTIPHVSTYEYHRDRERAPHLEQDPHRQRLRLAAEMVHDAAVRYTGDGVWGTTTVSDLGCGDGGLLSLVQDDPLIAKAWGYDWTPANVAGWAERGVKAEEFDVFGTDWPLLRIGAITVMTEVLEHLADPHGVLRRLCPLTSWLVASSPRDENAAYHDGSHAWAWDRPGYFTLISGAGFKVVRHENAGRFQVVLARGGR
jgi:hypothetical protein